MCNLYTQTRSVEEIARLFDVDTDTGTNVAGEIYPGYPAMVIAEGQLRSMVWGFPLSLKGKQGQPLKPKPVNNARTDKLESNFWRSSFESRRCLIPMTAFAEAEGKKGAKTRTWISVLEQPVFACAGIWRESAEWGTVYSMVMTDPSEATSSVHDRMPVILDPDQYGTWQSGSPGEAFALCKPYARDVHIERTDQPWTARR